MRKLAITLMLITGVMLSSSGAFALERMALLKADENAKGPVQSMKLHKLIEDALPIKPARPMLSALKKPDPEMKLRVDKSFGKMPLRFEKNDGQTAEEVKFLSRGKGYTMYFTPTESVMALTRVIDAPKGKRDPMMDSEPPKTETSVVRMEVVGGNAQANVMGEGQLPGTSNYFIGNDQTKWRQAVPNYAKVRYEEVYPGIDLVYYGNQQKLEYDFVVKPGANPKQIALKFKGTENLSINAKGDLVLKTKTGKVIQHAPIIYQTINGQKQPVAGSYKIDSDKVTFQLAQYDRKHDLVIDPVIGFSTFLGGTRDDFAGNIAVDPSGNVYVTGSTRSNDFNVLNPIEGKDPESNTDIIVFKLEVTDNVPFLAWSTYIGGNDSEFNRGLALDGSGNVYVVGATDSTDFNTVNEIEGNTVESPTEREGDTFVFKLEQANNIPTLAWSTYLGGDGSDGASDVMVDPLGNVYVVGFTGSTDFDTVNAIEGDSDGFDAIIFKLEQTNNVPTLAWSTYLGGNGSDSAGSITRDSFGNLYVVGSTSSTDFDLVNSIENANDGGIFVAKLEETNNVPSIIFSTMLEGNRTGRVSRIAVDSSGNIFGAGTEVNPPNPNASEADERFDDILVFKLLQANDVPSMGYFQFFGGGNHDIGSDLALDNSGNVYVTGITFGGLDLVNPIDGQYSGMGDAYIIKLSDTENVPSIEFSTFLGGGEQDWGFGIAVDDSGSIYLSGRTKSADLDAVNSIEDFNANQFSIRHDFFIAKIDPEDPLPVHNDFDADGDSDLFWLDTPNGDIGTALLRNSVIQSQNEFLQLDPSTGWKVNASGDFNGDRKADLLLFNTITGAIGVVRVDGTTLLDGAVVNTLNAAAGEVTRGTGDFDGDGKAEIIVQNLNTGDLSILFLDGNTVSSNEPVGQIDTSWNLVNTGLFNKDRNTDLLFYKKATGEVAIVEMDGSAIINASIVFSLEAGWRIVDTADFNGNKFSDVLVQHEAGDIDLIGLSNLTVLPTVNLGTLRADWQIVNAGLYGGESKADLLIQDKVNGDLFTLILNGTSATAINIITNLHSHPAETVHSGKP